MGSRRKGGTHARHSATLWPMSCSPGRSGAGARARPTAPGSLGAVRRPLSLQGGIMPSLILALKSAPQTAVAEERPREKLRTPAWTDRILWRPHGGLAQLGYGACAALTLSDHRPVAATFLLQARAGCAARRPGTVRR